MIDPRDLITQDAFVVAPELLGRPLARPWRRGMAFGIDSILILILSNMAGILFALAAALVLFRASAKRGVSASPLRIRRVMLRVVGAGMLFVAVLSGWNAMFDDEDEEPKGNSEAATTELAESGITGRQGLAIAAELMALRNEDSEDEARARARDAAQQLAAQGLDGSAIQGVLTAAASSTGAAVQQAVGVVADSVAQAYAADQAAATAASSPVELAQAFAEAAESPDSTRAAVLRSELTAALAGDSLTAMEQRVSKLDARVAALGQELAQAKKDRGILQLLRDAADELGLGFGWTALYFTAFLVLWRGQTPGKRLMGIRVLRLDAKPITWWVSFERFGGYVAGVFTGLLDYFLMIRDRNRQALHDKIVDTVVVWEGARAAPPAQAMFAARSTARRG